MTLEGNQGTEGEVEVDPLAASQSVQGEEQVEAELPEGTEGEGEGESKPLPKGTGLTLEQVQKHPAYSELHSRADRLENVSKHLTRQLQLSLEQVKTYKQQELNTIIERLGDSPDAQRLAQLVTDYEDRIARIKVDEVRLADVQKVETCNELITQYGIPEEYRKDLMAVSIDGIEKPTPGLLGRLMEERAKVLKDVLSRIPKGAVKPGSKQKIPALSFVPDKATGSVQPDSIDRVMDDYIKGRIDGKKYEKRMLALGATP